MSINSDARYESLEERRCGCFGRPTRHGQGNVREKIAKLKHKMYVKMHSARVEGAEKNAKQYQDKYNNLSALEQKIENSTDTVQMAEIVAETRDVITQNNNNILADIESEMLEHRQKETETLGLLQSMPDIPKAKAKTKTKKYTDKKQNKLLIAE